MSYVRIWVHGVFATKHREPLLTDAVRPALCEHLLLNTRKKQLFLDCVNGYHEHLHGLVQLPGSRGVGETIQLLKGGSSFWMNHEQNPSQRFAWQDDYFAISVSESQVEAVRRSIHRQHSFEEEAEAFGRRFGWDQATSWAAVGRQLKPVSQSPSAKANGKSVKSPSGTTKTDEF